MDIHFVLRLARDMATKFGKATRVVEVEPVLYDRQFRMLFDGEQCDGRLVIAFEAHSGAVRYY